MTQKFPDLHFVEKSRNWILKGGQFRIDMRLIRNRALVKTPTTRSHDLNTRSLTTITKAIATILKLHFARPSIGAIDSSAKWNVRSTKTVVSPAHMLPVFSAMRRECGTVVGSRTSLRSALVTASAAYAQFLLNRFQAFSQSPI